MRLKPVEITDDRGIRVPLYALSSLDTADPANAPLIEAVTRAGETIVHDSTRIRVPWRAGVLLVLGFILMLGLPLLLRKVVPTAPFWSQYIFMPVSLWPFLYLWRRHLRGRYSERMASAILAYGRCGSCGYVLDLSIAAGDHLVVCPECNAAWRADRVGLVRAAAVPTAIPAEDPLAPPHVFRGLWKWYGLGRMWNRDPSILDDAQRPFPLICREELSQRVLLTEDEIRTVRRPARRRAIRTIICLCILVPIYAGAAVFMTKTATWFFAFLLLALLFNVPVWVVQLRRMATGRSLASAQDTALLLRGVGVCPVCAARLPPVLSAPVQCGCGATWGPEKTGPSPLAERRP